MEGRNKNYRLFLMTIMLIMLADNVFGDFSMNSAGAEYRIPNLFLHNFINRINEQQESPMNPMDMILTNKDSIESNNYMYPDSSNYRIRKDYNEQTQQQSNQDELNHYHLQTRDDILLPREPVPRKEFLEHSSLYGHQYVQGGAGEGSQHLKPDGSISNIQVIKSDAVLPAYCNPPNPCPNGYSADDGCLEDFENSADFSKDYQSSQECMCDSEHMFNCPGNSDENELETLARSIQNEGITLDTTLNHIMETMDKNHKVVAKKYFIKKDENKSPIVKRSINNAVHYQQKSYKPNPFLVGEKLPVVAKKSPHNG